MNKISTIGFIGLGIMGSPMAKNLLKNGYSLNVYARRQQSYEPFTAYERVKIFSSPKDLAQASDVVISIVSDTPDVCEIMLAKDGVLEGIRAHALVIDMSTIAADTSRDLAARFDTRQVEFIDAPVSGGEIGAIEGTLSIMVGATNEGFQRAYPLIECLGKNIIHVGTSGAGQIAKACNQIVVAQTMVAVAEAYLLAQKSDVNPARVREALLGGFAYSRILEVHGQRMLDQTYPPGFKAKLHHKDLQIALRSAAEQEIELPASRLVADYMQSLVEQGDGELDSAAIAKIVGSG